MNEDNIIVLLSVAFTVIIIFGFLVVRETNRVTKMRIINDRLSDQIQRREFIIGEMEQIIKELREEEKYNEH